MIFVQALASDKSPSFACFELARNGILDLCVSLEVLNEVRGVMTRSKLQKKLPGLTAERTMAFLSDIASFSTFVSEVPRRFQYERDPKDECYVNLALAAQARYLVSRDTDLLDLADDEGFRHRFPDLRILGPVALLRATSNAASNGNA